MENKISNWSRILFLISTALLVLSLFYPIWRIELDAPQYPEGLMLQIYANKLGGQVEIVNGLNHYIGMQTLHDENFIEFTILPYIISSYALLFLITAYLGKKKLVIFTLWAFVLFGVIAMIDFWRWEYNYGHNLDPKAAIVVPGMSYQPPLIGFKQLLNFGAYSIPDIGGWFFIIGGVLILFSFMNETNIFRKFSKKKNNLIILFFLFFLPSCNNKLAQPIKLNYDKCNFCEMSISDGRFGAEIITEKGRAYKFDDVHCLFGFVKENNRVKISKFYINDYLKKNVLIDAEKSFYIIIGELKSPMGGNIAGFKSEIEARPFAQKFKVSVLNWNQIKF